MSTFLIIQENKTYKLIHRIGSLIPKVSILGLCSSLYFYVPFSLILHLSCFWQTPYTLRYTNLEIITNYSEINSNHHL